MEGSAGSNFYIFSVDMVANGLSFWLTVWRVDGYVDSTWLDLSLAYLINNNQLDKFLNVFGYFLASSNCLSTYSNSYCYYSFAFGLRVLSLFYTSSVKNSSDSLKFYCNYGFFWPISLIKLIKAILFFYKSSTISSDFCYSYIYNSGSIEASDSDTC